MVNGTTATETDTPNIVLIHCHDLGRYLGCYGYDVETPNIDALATEGVLLENLFCTAPQCSPSRSSLTTGTYPHENGVMGLAHMGWELDADATTLPEQLSDVGYSTHLLGFQHEVPHDNPKQLGYETTATGTKRALELVEVFDSFVADQDGPFFVSVGIEEPHRPFQREYVEDSYYGSVDPGTVELFPYLPDEPGIRTDIADLQSIIAGTLDRAIGEMQATIRDAGIASETLILFTTDHGLAMPRAKGTCYDPGLETAFIAHWPGRIEGGERHDALLSNIDVFPTILDIAGATVPEDSHGQSFAPVLIGDSEEGRDRVFGEMTWHDRYNPIRAIRTDRFKYIRNFSVSPRVFVPLDVVPTPAGRAVHEEYYVEQRPAEELYDLEADPHEQENLAPARRPFEPSEETESPEPGYEQPLAALREELSTWMAETNDPLLDGPVPYTAV